MSLFDVGKVAPLPSMQNGNVGLVLALSNEALTAQLVGLQATVNELALEIKTVLPRMNTATENLQLEVKALDELL